MKTNDATADAIDDLTADALETSSDKPPLIYYDSERKEYLMENSAGRWLAFNQAQLKRKLRALGHSNKAGDEPISEIEAILCDSEEHRDIRYAAPLAGRMAGFYEENGNRFLVTESPKFVEPAPGDWPTLKKVLRGLFTTDESSEIAAEQWTRLLGWLQHALISLRSGRMTQAQALAICGPANSGKSLFQKILTALLGGRAAKGARYMMGKTEFNADLCGAEHIMLEDEHMSALMRDRLHLGSQLKNFTVSTDTVSCHRKNRTPINLSVWWRISITLNDDPEDLRVLPPLNESIQDKIIILRAHSHPMPMPTTTPEEKAHFWQTLEAEFPAFVDYLLNSHVIEKADSSPRYGIETWHHPALAQSLHELSPEAHLLKMIDSVLWQSGRSEWKGTADELRAVLIEDHSITRDARKLLEHSNTCGSYLSRLSKSVSSASRVVAHRTNARREWRIMKEI